jgi:hypothetical protein
MNKSFALIFCCLCLLPIEKTFAQEPLFETLKKELNHNFPVLKEQSIPAYYISLRLDQTDWINCGASMGHLVTVGTKFSPTNRLSAIM